MEWAKKKKKERKSNRSLGQGSLELVDDSEISSIPNSVAPKLWHQPLVQGEDSFLLYGANGRIHRILVKLFLFIFFERGKEIRKGKRENN